MDPSSARPCSRHSRSTTEPALIIVISGPGGVGKGTLVRALVARDPSLWLSRSWTTRARRDGESEDAYHFVTRAEFLRHVAADEFLEWAEFLGNLYGTPWPHPPAETDVVLEIDVQGARQVVKRAPSALVCFLVPPSREEQRRRLLGRGDDLEKAEERLAVAENERLLATELGAHEVVNDALDVAVDEVLALIDAERLRSTHIAADS